MATLAIERLFKIAQYRNVSLPVADSMTARKRRGSTAISWPGQSTLSALATVGIHKRNLLEARMVVTTYNPHVQLLSLVALVG